MIVDKTLCVLWGITVSSLFITSFLNILSTTKAEHNSLVLLLKAFARLQLKHLGAEIITKLGKLYGIKKLFILDKSRIATHDLAKK